MVKGSHFNEEQLEKVRANNSSEEFSKKLKGSKYQKKRKEVVAKKIEEYYKNPNICKCGCGQIVPPITTRGVRFTKYICGHERKKESDPRFGTQRSKEICEKISQTRIEREIQCWSKGLTKDDHPSLKRTSDNMKINNPMQNEACWKKIVKIKKENGTNIIGARKALQTKITNGTLGGNGKCKWYLHNGQRVQGLFELKFVKFLDSMEIKWTAHKGVRAFKYIGLDGIEHWYQPDIVDENGVFYDPHAKYYWNEGFEHKINEVRKNYPDETFIVFHEDNYMETCKQIIESRINK